MTAYDRLIDDTHVLYKHLRRYFESFLARKTALQDGGTLSDLSARDHTVNEWLYDLEKRMQEVESALGTSAGSEHEQPVEIPPYVNHLKQQ
jgi:hypothetical protein